MKHKSRKAKPHFLAMAVGSVLEFQVYDSIGDDWYSDNVITGKTFAAAIKEAGEYDSIRVCINSPGGDAFEGVAICNILQRQGKPVEVVIDGIAASAASIIAMAGNSIVMAPNSMMMVHNASMLTFGNADELRKQAEILDQVSASIGETYVARTGKTAAEIKAIMDAETWMGAADCLAAGFCTSIVARNNTEACLAMARNFKALAKLPNLPAQLQSSRIQNDDEMEDDATCDCSCGPCQGGDCEGCDCEGCDAVNCQSGDCEHCTQDEAADAMANNLSAYEARLRLLELQAS